MAPRPPILGEHERTRRGKAIAEAFLVLIWFPQNWGLGGHPAVPKASHRHTRGIASAYQRRNKSFRRWYAYETQQQRHCNTQAARTKTTGEEQL